MTTRKRTRRSTTKDTNKPSNIASTTTDTHPSATSSSTTTTGGKTPSTTPAEVPKPKKQPPSPSLPPPPPPPPTPAHGLASVSPPGSKTPLSKFIYVLVLGATVLLAWYIYGMITLLAELKEEVGWWGVIIGGSGGGGGGGSPLGDRSNWQEWAWYPWRVSRTGEVEEGGSLEERLNALADELGIPSREVASAIKPVVPPASLTSLALGTRETERSEVVRVLLEDVKGPIAESEREDEWAEELEKESR